MKLTDFVDQFTEKNNAISVLIEKATNTSNAIESLQFTQAALNTANAFSSIHGLFLHHMHEEREEARMKGERASSEEKSE